ncbi:toll/interleukin-1 receptor domain-containing protein [Flavobacterium sp. I3-2]|uniref:toll/interleukin-1 receptor domain-containing protein n=1 Tax=Flavobacterium sp. I3-2 TaxID=2748319 RepID=UPI0015AE862E|nr:toll/interleukin-1 receptor domain-containing protein [Flavobacterium sp. I3-2]
MSIQSITNSIASLDRDIKNIENQLNTVNNNLSRKEKEANSIFEKISKEKDLKKIVNLQKDLTRKNDEINRITKDKSTKTKNLSDKQNKRLKLLQDLNKEEQKERDKTKREQKEMLSLQQSITREMQLQKQLASESFSKSKELNNKHETISKNYDVFVSHASEDKTSFVRPFVESLKSKGVEVWYDEFELDIGDSLRRSIENGLKKSKYGIVVLSEAFFSKEWPQRELDGLFAREVNGEKVILPIWHKISKNEVLNFSPIIADMLAINTTDFTIEEISDKIANRLRR